MSLGHSGACLHVSAYRNMHNLVYFIYRDDVRGSRILVSDLVSSSGEVCFTVGADRPTHLRLQESLAKKLGKGIEVLRSEGYTHFVLITNVKFLLQLLGKSELTQLLFADSKCLRRWGKDVLQLGGCDEFKGTD